MIVQIDTKVVCDAIQRYEQCPSSIGSLLLLANVVGNAIPRFVSH